MRSVTTTYYIYFSLKKNNENDIDEVESNIVVSKVKVEKRLIIFF